MYVNEVIGFSTVARTPKTFVQHVIAFRKMHALILLAAAFWFFFFGFVLFCVRYIHRVCVYAYIYVPNVVESAQGNVGTVGRFACMCVCANALSNEITSVGSFGYYSHWNVNEIHNELHGAHLFRRKYNYMQNAVNSLFHFPFC